MFAKLAMHNLARQRVAPQTILASKLVSREEKRRASRGLYMTRMHRLSLADFYGAQAFNYRLSNPAAPKYTAMAPE
jgi:hypothetical protein